MRFSGTRSAENQGSPCPSNFSLAQLKGLPKLEPSPVCALRPLVVIYCGVKVANALRLLQSLRAKQYISPHPHPLPIAGQLSIFFFSFGLLTRRRHPFFFFFFFFFFFTQEASCWLSPILCKACARTHPWCVCCAGTDLL